MHQRRDPRLDKEALQRTIDADLKRQAKARLRELRAALADAHRAEREACGAARQKARERIRRLRERREAIRAQVRRMLEREREAKRAACGTKRHVPKGKRAACATARTKASRRAARLRARRERLPEVTRALIGHERARRNSVCHGRSKSGPARAALREERLYQESLRRSASFVRHRSRRPGLVRTRARRAESDEEVRQNLPSHLHGLFNRVRRGIKGSSRKSRTEEFLEYVEEHPEEEFADADDATDRLVADLERQMRAGRRDPRRRR